MNASEDSSKLLKTNQNIQVYVRVRPTNSREKLIRSHEVIEVHGPRDVIAKQMVDSRSTKKFSFDRAFGMDSQQHEVYASVVSPMIDEVLSGYNCTVFAYGQTGTGKTYTMVGEEQPTLSSTQEDASNVGIIPRALNHLFDELRMMEVEFAMRVSYLELYNEELCDLLSTDDSAKIRIFDDVNKKGSVIVQGLEEIPVRCKSDVYRLLAKGQERRKTAATLMNAQSSRSHTVFSILVHIKENGIDGEEMLKIGKLNLVDLAGSENISKAGNEKGIRTRESVNINQSLLTLGRVITALVERTPHIPYRESKLTRLLQESLGGRTKTSIIATVSPGHKDLEETLSTLDYAHRAKNIQNKPEINQRLTKKVVLKEYSEEIDRLKRDLNAAREKNGIYLASDTYNDMLYKMETQQKELNEKIHLFKNLKEELAEKSKLFDDCQMNLEEISRNLVVEQSKNRITEAELTKTKRNLRKTERKHEETRHLVVCHQKTEKELTEHAKQLMEVAEEASVDTKFLLDSIDRRKNVEENAISANELLLKNLSNNIVEMKHETEKLKKDHKNSTNLIVNDIEKNTNAKKLFTATITSTLRELGSLHSNSIDQIQKIIVDWKKITDGITQSDTNELMSAIQKLEQQQASFNAALEEKLKSVEVALMKEATENKAIRLQLLEKINHHNAEIDCFCSELKTNFTKHCEEFNKLSTQLKTKSTAQNSKIQEIERILAEVKELSKEADPVHKSIDDLNSNFMETETNTINVFSEKNSLILGEKMGCLKNVEDSNDEMCDKLSKQLTVIVELVKDDDGKTKANLKEQNDCVASLKSQLKVQLDSVESDIGSELSEYATNVASKETALIELVKNENAKSSTNAQEIKSLVQHTLNGIVRAAESNVCDKLNSCANEIKRFEEQDVLKYKSTGETPAKKDYNFNKQLIATSPHDRIIKRLRLENNIPPSLLDDSIIEVSDETVDIIANSTPLRTQNLTGIELNENDKMKSFKELELSKVEGKENEQSNDI